MAMQQFYIININTVHWTRYLLIPFTTYLRVNTYTYDLLYEANSRLWCIILLSVAS